MIRQSVASLTTFFKSRDLSLILHHVEEVCQGHLTCKAIIETGKFMVKKTVVLGLCLIGTMETAIAEVVGDSITSEQLKEVIVVGNSARQRIDNTRLGAERLEMSKIMQVTAFGG